MSERYRAGVTGRCTKQGFWRDPAPLHSVCTLRFRRTLLETPKYLICLVRPEGLEPPTIRLEGGCSIQLSYGRKTL